MDMLLGSHVLEHGKRVGRLAGFELEPAERRVRRLIFSPDGELGPQAMTRPLSAIGAAAKGRIELAPPTDATPLPTAADVALIGRATRLVSNGRDQGRVVGIGVDLATRQLLSVSGRQHWWSRRVSQPASALDFSISGQIRLMRSDSTRAA